MLPLVLTSLPAMPLVHADLGADVVAIGSGARDTYSMAWGDWDNDGDLDLALGNDGYNQVYANDSGTLTLAWESPDFVETYSVAWGDWNGDGNADLAVGNYADTNRVYTSDGSTLTLAWDSGDFSKTTSVAWGDWDGDNDLDLAVGNYAQSNRVYENDGGTFNLVWEGTKSDRTQSVAWGDWDGDNDLDLAVGNYSQLSAVYENDSGALVLDPAQEFGWEAPQSNRTRSVAWGDWDRDNDLDLAMGNYGEANMVYENDGGALLLDPAQEFGWQSTGDEQDTTSMAWGDWDSDGTLDLAVGNDGAANQVYTWTEDAFALAWDSGDTDYTYSVAWADWDSDNDADLAVGNYFGTPQIHINTLNNLDLDGNQIRVLMDGQPVENAMVYLLPEDMQVGGDMLVNDADEILWTNEHGYLQGEAQISVGDRLFAMNTITDTESFSVYYTNGTPTEVGVDTFSVTEPGLHELHVSEDHPLVLFHLDIALEWDASNDPTYLDQLNFNIQRTSQYLYDITNGQAALGDVVIYQNADNWAYSHILVHATNSLRPYAAQGGIVITPTVDPDHSDIVYDIGQVAMGSTWNRYGNPGYDLDNDWPVVLAHELGHYLFFQDEVYLGMNQDDILIAVDTCIGSVMGDPYTDERNTEFIADDDNWNNNCYSTLANQTLWRDEWDTVETWYPWLHEPASLNPGPSLMPFDLTYIHIEEPITPTNALEDPTFYLDYTGGLLSSPDARAFLMRDDYVVDVGSPVGGQNRLLARGAQPGDRLCVYDRSRHQYGCEIVEMGDDRLSLEEDTTWAPVVQISPVTSMTLDIDVAGLSDGLPLYARLYPEYGLGEDVISLTYDAASDNYHGTFNLSDIAMAGNIQIWVDETDTEYDTRRETMVEYAIGGNPGGRRSSRTDLRNGGGRRSSRADLRFDGGRRSSRTDLRGAMGGRRSSRGDLRVKTGAVLSADGQMFFFSPNPLIFDEGEFYTIQSMAGLPSLPPGRTAIGEGYNLLATPGAPMLEGSIAFEYLGSDVLAAGGNEANLTIYFWDGIEWTALHTVRDTYYNLMSARSQGPGVYALMSSVQIPLEAVGWNLIAYPVQETRPVEEALASIDGKYTQVLGHRVINGQGYLWAWDSYIPDLPPIFQRFNTLHELRFGKGYFVNATETTTIHLPHDSSQSMAEIDEALEAEMESMPKQTPATYFGTVEPSEQFTPAADMPVTARVGDTVCGETMTQEVDGQVIYMVLVAGNEAGVSEGCGMMGSVVTFQVGDQVQTTAASWDDSTPHELNLRSTVQRVYLPLMH
jgi:hypothetical protein